MPILKDFVIALTVQSFNHVEFEGMIYLAESVEKIKVLFYLIANIFFLLKENC